MNYMQIMEQNLAQLLNQHQSLPHLLQSEPTDPFQKRQFGKKMRKSAVNVQNQSNTNFNYHSSQTQKHNDNPATLRPLPQFLPNQPKKANKCEQDEQVQQKMREISFLFDKLRSNLSVLQEDYKEKVYGMCKQGKSRHHQINELMGNLEGSVEFILRNCLTLEQPQSNFRDDKRRRAESDKENVRMNQHLPDKIKRKEVEQRQIEKEKSVYEAVLEERQRRAKKKMI